MNTPDPQLIAALSNPAVMPLSDADALAAINAPILTPRPYRITAASLADILGGTAAIALQAGLSAAIAAGTATGASQPAQQFGALCQYAQLVLAGAGFDPANATAQQLVQEFVAAGVIQQTDAVNLLNMTRYVAGSIRQLAEVTSARQSMTRQSLLASITSAGASLLNEWIPTQSDPSQPAPTQAAVIATMQSLLTSAGVA